MYKDKWNFESAATNAKKTNHTRPSSEIVRRLERGGRKESSPLQPSLVTRSQAELKQISHRLNGATFFEHKHIANMLQPSGQRDIMVYHVLGNRARKQGRGLYGALSGKGAGLCEPSLESAFEPRTAAQFATRSNSEGSVRGCTDLIQLNALA